MTQDKNEHPRLEGVQSATEAEWRAITNIQKELEQLGQSGNEAQLWICLVVKIMSDAVKNNNA